MGVLVLAAGGVTGLMLSARNTSVRSPVAVTPFPPLPSNLPTDAPIPTDPPTPSDVPGPTDSGGNPPFVFGNPFTDPDGNFTVIFEATPDRSTGSVTIDGAPVSFVKWDVQTQDPKYFTAGESVTVGVLPAGYRGQSASATLRAAVSSEVASTKAQLLSETPGMFQGFPFIDAVLAIGDGHTESRTILAGHTLFTVSVAGISNPPVLFGGTASTFVIHKHAP